MRVYIAFASVATLVVVAALVAAEAAEAALLVLLVAIIVAIIGALLPAGDPPRRVDRATVIAITKRSTRHLRASNEERDIIAAVLLAHHEEGRLSESDFEVRQAKAMSALTRGNLANLLRDLPHLKDDRQGGYVMHESYDDRAAA